MADSLKSRVITWPTVIPSEARNLDLVRLGIDEKKTRARFLAEFTLSTQSEILRFAQDDSEGLGMTGHCQISEE
jgi:hypothetical protein